MIKNNIKKVIEIAKKIRLIVFDFDGVFTDNRVFVFEDGKEAVLCNRSDGWGIKLLKENGIEGLVISNEVNPVVGARCRKLKLDYIQSLDGKLKILEEEVKKRKISLKEIAYLGNDVNDLECLKKVGLPACVRDSHPEVLKTSLYITKFKGGRGAVREFCEFIIRAKGGKIY